MNDNDQIIFETERLKLIVLDPRQLSMLAEDLPALEKELGVSYQADPVEGVFKQIIEGQAAVASGDPDNYIWHSFWLIVRKSDNTVVGSADFKRPPDKLGEVEIGYGLGEQFEHNGYMTETVRFMCGWAEKRGDISAVIAQTEPENIPSHNVLKRCGFSVYKREENLWWKKSLQQ